MSRSTQMCLLLCALAMGCNAASANAEEDARLVAETGLARPAPMAKASVAREPEAKSVEPMLAPTPVEPEPEPEAIDTRIARQRLTVFVQPDPSAGLRGRIPMSAAFEVFAYVDGPQCGGKGWADVGKGYVCAEKTRPAKGKKPRVQPMMRSNGLPFYYAKIKKGDVARRWESIKDYEVGLPHLDTLEPDHDYAFEYRRRASDREVVLVDDKKRVVLAKEVRQARPSKFAGRDLVAEPVPEGKVLAWAVTWPEANAFAEPAPDAKLARALGYHEVLILEPEPAEDRWHQISGGGYVHARHVSRFVPSTEVPPDVGAGEIWIDVELEEQTLAVMRGADAEYATLISSGFKSPTPRGVFRIHVKQAQGTMTSRPDDDEYYNVEAVPYVQYFHQAFALHAAYWHHRFGHKISHGCVNLSPRDAAHVYSLTGPHARPGWIHAYESEDDLGTTIRIRQGNTPIDDRRGAVQPVRIK